MAKTPPFSVCYEYCVGGGGTNENGIIVVNTEYESADAIPVFTKTGEVAKKLNDVHCGVFKVSFKESEYNGVSTALIFQTTWWSPTNNATENCYQLMYECNGLFRIREEITITVFKTLAWKAIDISNKKTVINNRADDESYPTTLAVKKFVDAHTSNGDIHVTLEDKQKWNDKYTKEEVNSKFALIENGIIEVKETVVGNLNNILVYDKNGNVATDIENIHTGTFRLFVKYEDENPDVIFIQPDGYLLMEQRVMTFDGMGGNEIVQTILMNNQLYTRVTGDLNFLVGEFGEFAAIDLTPVDTLESDDANAPLSANMGRELNEKKENTSNKSDVIDDTANDSNYPTTKAVKDYVDTSAELNTIVNTAEGFVINVNDSANAKLKGLTIYGKTTQAAEPSIENPQDLINVGNSGSITTEVYGKNLFNPSGISCDNIYSPTSTLVTENTFGTEITSTEFDGKISVTQATFDIANNKNSYKNGFVMIGLYNNVLKFNKSYTLIADIKITKDLGTYGTISVVNQAGATGECTIKNNKLYHYFNFVQSPTKPVCRYLDLRVNGMSFELSNIMIVEGNAVDKDIPYEPFKEQTLTLNTPNGLAGVPVTSGGNYTDENGQQWICDEIDLTRGKYVQRTYKFINTGEKTIAYAPSKNGVVTCRFNLSLKAIKNVGISSHFKLTTKWADVETIPYLFFIEGNVLYISVNAEDIGADGTETESERRVMVNNWIAKTFSEDNPLIVYYALAEPIETDLELTDWETEQYKALTTNKPVTNVFNDADAHMKVDYVADTKNYIDNKFANIENAILSLGGNV